MTDQFDRLTAALAGHYAIEKKLGAGGMASVYLAEDLKHHRKVAVKVLRPELAAVIGAERFVQEIETTANLQHPHILPLFDSGEADSFLYYVMPFIEGESLEDQIKREKQLPVDEAIRITEAVASALDYAHRHDVVHRDIKPANILIHDGQPVVSDFGIALAVTAAGGERMTETGLSLGTPHYMSPEQAMADRDVTGKSDQYSLACMTYEMLTGDPPHTGSTAQAIVAKIITEEPRPVTAARHTVPPSVDMAIQRALQKLPADRFQTTAEFASALTDSSSASHATGHPKPMARQASGTRSVLVAYGIAAVFGVTALFQLTRPNGQSGNHRFSLALPHDERLIEPDVGSPFTLSPDGMTLLYAGPSSEGRWQLWTRRLDELSGRPLPGTGEALNHTIDRSGTEFAFWYIRQGGVWSMRLDGVGLQQLSDPGRGQYGWQLSYGADGTLYYSHGANARLNWITPHGDREFVELDFPPDFDVAQVMFLDVLPGGRGGVITATDGSGRGQVQVFSVRFDDGSVEALARGVYARYAASGHLLWVTADGTLWAARFDRDRLEFTGEAVPMVENIQIGPIGSAYFVISESGSLLYRTAEGSRFIRPVWVDRSGVEIAMDSTLYWPYQSLYASVRLSPDDTRLAMRIPGEERADIWVKELPAGPLTRITSRGTQNYRMEWMPDGRTMTFMSNQLGSNGVFIRRADPVGADSVLIMDEPNLDQGLISQDGRWLIYRSGSAGGRDILARRTGAADAPIEVATSDAEEYAPALSPDGQWLAYVSDQSGRPEVYVRSFPDGEMVTQVSSSTGYPAQWSHTGRELFYRNGAGDMIAATVETEPVFTIVQQRSLFSVADYMVDPFHAAFDVDSDDQRFVFLKPVGDERNELIWIENFFAELRERAGG